MCDAQLKAQDGYIECRSLGEYWFFLTDEQMKDVMLPPDTLRFTEHIQGCERSCGRGMGR